MEEVVERRVMLCTGYTNKDPGMDGRGITKSGSKTIEGRTVAADKSLPFGTEIFIPELGKHLVVTDRGSAITDGRLDLYFEKREDAIEFGVRWLEVLIKK